MAPGVGTPLVGGERASSLESDSFVSSCEPSGWSRYVDTLSTVPPTVDLGLQLAFAEGEGREKPVATP